jgi:hypothetical protein
MMYNKCTGPMQFLLELKTQPRLSPAGKKFHWFDRTCMRLDYYRESAVTVPSSRQIGDLFGLSFQL